MDNENVIYKVLASAIGKKLSVDDLECDRSSLNKNDFMAVFFRLADLHDTFLMKKYDVAYYGLSEIPERIHSRIQDIAREEGYDYYPDYLIQAIGLDIVNKNGKIIKRIAKFAKEKFGWKMSSEELGILGGMLNNLLPLGYIPFDITDDFNWRAGDYGDEGSCYWSCRASARDILADNNALAIRFYSDKDYTDGSGRAWLYPLPEHHGVGIFNAYGPYQIERIANFLKQYIMTQKPQLKTYSKKINFSFDGETTGTLWINSGSCVLLSSVEYPRLTGLNMTNYNKSSERVTCHDCGEEIPAYEANEIDGDYYCNDCSFYCEYCENACIGESYYVENYGSVCQHCFDAAFGYCEICENFYHQDNITYTGRFSVCGGCLADCYVCQNCGEIYRSRQEINIVENDIIICNNCMHSTTACHDCGKVFYDDDTSLEWAEHEPFCDECFKKLEKSHV